MSDKGIANGGNPTVQTFSFNLAHILGKKFSRITADPEWRNEYVDFKIARNTEFWYCDVLECIKYLLGWQSYRGNMLWLPVREFDRTGERVYTEINTGNEWWNTQVLGLISGNVIKLTSVR